MISYLQITLLDQKKKRSEEEEFLVCGESRELKQTQKPTALCSCRHLSFLILFTYCNVSKFNEEHVSNLLFSFRRFSWKRGGSIKEQLQLLKVQPNRIVLFSTASTMEFEADERRNQRKSVLICWFEKEKLYRVNYSSNCIIKTPASTGLTVPTYRPLLSIKKNEFQLKRKRWRNFRGIFDVLFG